MKSRKRGKPGKKTTLLQSAALGCTVLAAVLAGAWVLFPKEVEEAATRLTKAAGLRPEEPKKPEASPFPFLKQEQEAKTAGPQQPASINLPSAETAQPKLPALVPAGTGQPAPPRPMSCSQAAGSLRGFIDAQDKKAYVKEFKLKQPLLQHLAGLKDKLSAKPPAVVRETDDLYTVLSNTAHFFRVLGKDNIQLLKVLLEQGELEDIAAALHAASVGSDCPADMLQLSFSTAYEYSVFFLNTIGGRSYLFRREARVRLLISYYALLILDEANSRYLNTHGTDISGLIQPLIREMETSSQLARKEEYVARLREMAERYPMKK